MDDNLSETPQYIHQLCDDSIARTYPHIFVRWYSKFVLEAVPTKVQTIHYHPSRYILVTAENEARWMYEIIPQIGSNLIPSLVFRRKAQKTRDTR